MSVGVSKARLAAITKELWVRWNETRDHWADAKCDEFERKYMEELFTTVEAALGVIDQIDKVSAKIRSDCE